MLGMLNALRKDISSGEMSVSSLNNGMFSFQWRHADLVKHLKLWFFTSIFTFVLFDSDIFASHQNLTVNMTASEKWS